jgi:hypothetical protein
MESRWNVHGVLSEEILPILIWIKKLCCDRIKSVLVSTCDISCKPLIIQIPYLFIEIFHALET